MSRNFKLTGNTEAKFKKLETILPRIMKRMNHKTVGIIPSSVLSSFIHEPGIDGLLFRGCMFACDVNSIAFKIMEIKGKKMPTYKCVAHLENETRSKTAKIEDVTRFSP